MVGEQRSGSRVELREERRRRRIFDYDQLFESGVQWAGTSRRFGLDRSDTQQIRRRRAGVGVERLGIPDLSPGALNSRCEADLAEDDYAHGRTVKTQADGFDFGGFSRKRG